MQLFHNIYYTVLNLLLKCQIPHFYCKFAAIVRESFLEIYIEMC